MWNLMHVTCSGHCHHSRGMEMEAVQTLQFCHEDDYDCEKHKKVIIEKLGEPNLTYNDFAASLPADECKYCIYHLDFVTKEGCQKSKIFFIARSPGTANIRSNMLYASSKDRFKRELDGIQVELQATDPTEMGLDVTRGRVN